MKKKLYFYVCHPGQTPLPISEGVIKELEKKDFRLVYHMPDLDYRDALLSCDGLYVMNVSEIIDEKTEEIIDVADLAKKPILYYRLPE